MTSFKKEFKELILQSNVMDIAVGIVIGGAFGKVISSLVDDILTPIIGLSTGGTNPAELAYEVKPVEFNEFGKEIVSATIFNYRLFIQDVADFLIVTLVIFIMIHAINGLRRKYEELTAPAPGPSGEIKLLTGTHNLLDKKQ